MKNISGFLYQLDIYGPIDSSYENEFKIKMEETNENINYCGIVTFNKSVDTLKNYDCLLFPTYWNGEGFPGTIIDAFSAGVPVIASDWNCNKEIIDNKVNGIIYPNNEIIDLKDAIIYITGNREYLKKMRINCVQKAQQYMPDKYIKRIIEKIEEKE